MGLPAAEAVPLLLRINKVEEARELARQHRDKQPELLNMVSAHVVGSVDSTKTTR